MHDCRYAANSPDYLGSMKFYDFDLPCAKGVEEIDVADFLAVFRVTR